MTLRRINSTGMEWRDALDLVVRYRRSYDATYRWHRHAMRFAVLPILAIERLMK